MAELKRLARAVTTLPDNLTLHSRVQKIIDDRRQMGEGKLSLDWGMGGTLAYASLLTQGFGVRLSGEDTARGTFFHRHAVLHDQNREKWDAGTYLPTTRRRQAVAVCRHRFRIVRRGGAGFRIRLLDLQTE